MAEKEAGSEDFVDPQPPARLSRRNVIALALTVAGVLLVLFLGSRRPRPQAEPGYLGSAPLEISREPFAAPWSPPPEETHRETIEETRAADHRIARFEEALRSRPLVTSVEARGDASPAAAGAPQALGDYTVAEGSVIEAVLMTGIHSARPGPVTARTVLPVHDTVHRRHVLIPAGTRLVGSMQQALAGEDKRVVLAWTRMIFPNGRTHDLPGLPAVETTGEAGLADKVRSHRARIFGSAALLALLGTTSAQASAGLEGAGGVAGAAMAIELSRVASGMVAQGLSPKPTVTVRPGYRFAVYVSQDLTFDGPYR